MSSLGFNEIDVDFYRIIIAWAHLVNHFSAHQNRSKSLFMSIYYGLTQKMKLEA